MTNLKPFPVSQAVYKLFLPSTECELTLLKGPEQQLVDQFSGELPDGTLPIVFSGGVGLEIDVRSGRILNWEQLTTPQAREVIASLNGRSEE